MPVPRIDPYACPGFTTALALRRQRLMTERRTEASHQVDEAHVGFAPYVDLMVVDAETRTLLEQEARRNPDLLPNGIMDRIRAPGSLDSVIAAVEDL